MKRSLIFTLLTVTLLLLLILPWWWSLLAQPAPPVITTSSAKTSSDSMAIEPIQPIPQPTVLNRDKVALGERLFDDRRLSHDNSMACTTCHVLQNGGADHRAHSMKVDGKLTAVNTLTIFNAALNFNLNWTGEFSTFEEQIDRVLKVNLSTDWLEVIPKLKQDPEYVASFNKLYPEGITVHTVKDAITTYERSLTTPNSRFDKFLRGDAQAITADEQRGYALFKSYGCVACHQGVNVGGNMYQKFGVMSDYFSDRGHPEKVDLGRFNHTRQEADRHSFRVPSLRNVALTAPYLHDGSARTLGDVVDIMAKYQLGRPIPAPDRNSIIAFLKTLTGEYQGKLLSGD